MSNQQIASYNRSESISERTKRVFQNKIFIVFFLIPAFVPVALLIFLPMAFNVLVAIFRNPGLNDIPQWYFDTKNLASIRWGDFFYFISRNDSGGKTGVYLLITLLMFVVFTYIFYTILNKLKFFNKNKFYSFLVAIILSFISPPLFDYIYIHVFIVLLDIINRFIVNLTGQNDFFLLFAPLNNIRLVVNSVQVDFLDILLNTIVWTVTCVFFHVVLGIFLALLMNKEFPGRAFFRTIFILPWAIPQFVTALIWRNFIFSYNQGILGKPMYQNYVNNSLNPLSFTILDLFTLFVVFASWALLISAVVSLLKTWRLFKNSRMFIALLLTIIP